VTRAPRPLLLQSGSNKLDPYCPLRSSAAHVQCRVEEAEGVKSGGVTSNARLPHWLGETEHVAKLIAHCSEPPSRLQ